MTKMRGQWHVCYDSGLSIIIIIIFMPLDTVPEVMENYEIGHFGNNIDMYIRVSVNALSRDGMDMRGDAQNPKSFQAPRM